MNDIRMVAIAHRYPLDRLALSQIIKRHDYRIMISEQNSIQELLEHLDRYPNTDLLLIDLALFQNNSLQLLQDLRDNHPELQIVTISHEENTSSQVLRALGIAGNISSKDSKQTVSYALQRVAQGRCWFSSSSHPENDSASSTSHPIEDLSQQEWRVMDKLYKGLMNKQIADELQISINTTKIHVQAILRKLGVKNRTQAVLALRQQVSNDSQYISRHWCD